MPTRNARPIMLVRDDVSFVHCPRCDHLVSVFNIEPSGLCGQCARQPWEDAADTVADALKQFEAAIRAASAGELPRGLFGTLQEIEREVMRVSDLASKKH